MVAIDFFVNTIPVHKNTSIAQGNIFKKFEYLSLSDPLSGPMSSYILTKSTLVTHCLWDWDSHFTENTVSNCRLLTAFLVCKINQVALLCRDSLASWWQSLKCHQFMIICRILLSLDSDITFPVFRTYP